METSERIKKVNSATRYLDEGNSINAFNRTASHNYYEEIDDMMKPCLRILHLLKSNKNSWPFLLPVDPVALGIPNYLDIIKEPMDLQTVEQNIKKKYYSTPSQFHADVEKIISNSYEFNKNNL